MTLVQTEPKKIYIRVDYEWQPGANTLAYYPLETDTNDYSGNNRNATNSGATFTTIGQIECASFSNQNTKIYLPALGNITTLTASLYFKTTINVENSCILGLAPTTDNKNFVLGCNYGTGVVSRWDGVNAYNITDGTVNNGMWHHIVGVYSSGGAELYIDNVLIGTDATSTTVYSDYGYSFIGGHQSGQSRFSYSGYISNVILEDKARTETEISDYYNSTKALYGIS